MDLEFDVMMVLNDIATTLNWTENDVTATELIKKFNIGSDEERFDDIIEYLVNKYSMPIILS